jgi:hypothetical protein
MHRKGSFISMLEVRGVSDVGKSPVNFQEATRFWQQKREMMLN